ncbi:MAG: DUF47 domain-containing protein [Gemmatimonadaceae bacterium]
MRLIPHDERFFEMFRELAHRLSAASKLLNQLFGEPEHIQRHMAAIKSLEHEADTITHDIIARIDTSFVTPFDREDIHMLASRLDDVIDLLDGTARRAGMFHITEAREPAKRLTEVLVRATACIELAVIDMKKPKIVFRQTRHIKNLEEEGDALYYEAVGGLFGSKPDALEVIKWKELYDTLERAIDQCEDVANVLESISLKHA